MERLKHQPEGPPVAIRPAVPGAAGIEERFPVQPQYTTIRRFKEVQTAQKCGFSLPGGADKGQDLPLLQGDVHILEHLRSRKVLAQAKDLQICHGRPHSK